MLFSDTDLDTRFVDCKPFLRWAGGKTWLTSKISDFLPPSGFNSYHEPFLGGGSIFFKLQPANAYLSDLNEELISTYIQVRDNVEDVLHFLKKFKNTEDEYYKVRAQKFRSESKKAARFIYLNQTSFNGIYRVNLQGQYNVPFGHRNKNFYNPSNLIQASKMLESTKLRHLDFEDTLRFVKKGDLVFLDPPYTVTHNNNGFIRYNSKLFNESSQQRLSSYIDSLLEIGAYYILTNAAHKWIKKTFDKPSAKVLALSRLSCIGGNHAKRGHFEEYIFTNTLLSV